MFMEIFMAVGFFFISCVVLFICVTVYRDTRRTRLLDTQADYVIARLYRASSLRLESPQGLSIVIGASTAHASGSTTMSTDLGNPGLEADTEEASSPPRRAGGTEGQAGARQRHQ